MNGESFLSIGTDGKVFPLNVPYPTVGDATFDAQENIVTQENANGALVGQVRGKTRVSQTVGWSQIEAAAWHTICRWFEANGPFCHVRYFSQAYGEWRTGQFLCTQFTCDPILVGADGMPQFYDNAKFTLMGTGR